MTTLLANAHQHGLNLTFAGSNLLFAVGSAAGLAVGAYLYTRGEATIGTAVLLVSYTGMLFGPLESIREQVQDFQKASAGITRIDALLQEQPAVREPAVPRSLPAGPLSVEIDHLGFAEAEAEAEGWTSQNRLPGMPEGTPISVDPGVTPDSNDIGHGTTPNDGAIDDTSVADPRDGTGDAATLRDITLRLAPGRTLGLLGRTGSGKTTLTRLLFRLYDPTDGAVRLGGVNVRDVAFQDLRRRVGLVTQDVQLFQASVRDNLTFFDASISDDRLLAVLDELGLMVWLRGLPDGLDTRLAAGGQGLSAGEAQLLALCRIFLRDPDLVVLDEASSRLDPAAEHLLERASAYRTP